MNKRFVLYGITLAVCFLIFCVTLAACLTEFYPILASPYSAEVGAGMCLVLCYFFGLISFGLLCEFAYYVGGNYVRHLCSYRQR